MSNFEVQAARDPEHVMYSRELNLWRDNRHIAAIISEQFGSPIDTPDGEHAVETRWTASDMSIRCELIRRTHDDSRATHYMLDVEDLLTGLMWGVQFNDHEVAIVLTPDAEDDNGIEEIVFDSKAYPEDWCNLEKTLFDSLISFDNTEDKYFAAQLVDRGIWEDNAIAALLSVVQKPDASNIITRWVKQNKSIKDRLASLDLSDAEIEFVTAAHARSRKQRQGAI